MPIFDRMPEPKPTPKPTSSTSPQTRKAGPKPVPVPKKEYWSDAQAAQMVEGILPEQEIKARLVKHDANGMLVSTYATLRSAKKLDEVKSLLETPEKELTQVDAMMALLERILQNQVTLQEEIKALRGEIRANVSTRYGSSAPSNSRQQN